MSVIEFAEKRLEEEAQRERTMYLTGRESNTNDLLYWAAYLDGARAQKNELTRFPSWEGSKTIDLPKMEVQE